MIIIVSPTVNPDACKKNVDCNKTNAGRSPPWCWDDAAQSVLGVTAPQVMQSATSQLIVMCKNNAF